MASGAVVDKLGTRVVQKRGCRWWAVACCQDQVNTGLQCLILHSHSEAFLLFSCVMTVELIIITIIFCGSLLSPFSSDLQPSWSVGQFNRPRFYHFHHYDAQLRLYRHLNSLNKRLPDEAFPQELTLRGGGGGQLSLFIIHRSTIKEINSTSSEPSTMTELLLGLNCGQESCRWTRSKDSFRNWPLPL